MPKIITMEENIVEIYVFIFTLSPHHTAEIQRTSN